MKISEETRKLMTKLSVTDDDVEALIKRYNDLNETPFEGTTDEQKANYATLIRLFDYLDDAFASSENADAVDALREVQDAIQELANQLGRC